MSDVITVSAQVFHAEASKYRHLAQEGAIVYVQSRGYTEAAMVSVADARRLEALRETPPTNQEGQH